MKATSKISICLVYCYGIMDTNVV